MAFGLVLSVSGLAWPFIVINMKLCSAELEEYFVRWYKKRSLPRQRSREALLA